MAVIRTQRMGAGVLQVPGQLQGVVSNEDSPEFRAGGAIVYTAPANTHVVVRRIDLIIQPPFSPSGWDFAAVGFVPAGAAGDFERYVLLHLAASNADDRINKYGRPYIGQLTLYPGEGVYVETSAAEIHWHIDGAILT